MNNLKSLKKTTSYPSERKKRIIESADRLAPERQSWIQKNWFYYQNDERYMQFLVPAGQRVLDIGCGTGGLLSALRPSFGVGIDISFEMIKLAKNEHPAYTFHVGDIEDPETLERIEGTFDYIVLSDTIGQLEDCEQTIKNLQKFCTTNTRLIISYYSHLWEPAVSIAEILGGKMPQPHQNWLSSNDIFALLNLSDFDVIKREWRQLLPKHILGLGTLVNRYVATLPGIRKLCLRNYIVARAHSRHAEKIDSATVVIPCRNEKGNIEVAINRLPQLCNNMEVIFVEGNSSDGTYEEMLRVRDANPNKDIKVLKQDGTGKADAVRKGFDAASGDVLMILDGDLTVRPEDMPKFYSALVNAKGEFINGTRLVYPMEKNAMRPLNLWANRCFALIFSWLINQRITDSLCGTKVLSRKAYRRIADDQAYFGDFDPFGDFDLLFGASKQNLKIIEIPVRYDARSYGETQISRFSDGWKLLQMVVFAFKKLKSM